MAQFDPDNVPYNIKVMRKLEGCREKSLRGFLEFSARFGREELKPSEIRKMLNLTWVYDQQQDDLKKNIHVDEVGKLAENKNK